MEAEEDVSKLLAGSERGFIIAPAGCGKTELIAQAVSHAPGRRQLVLTHTHAGVKSLRDKLRRRELRTRDVEVSTIASFAQLYVTSYPRIANYLVPEDSAPDWNNIYEAASRLLETRVGRDVLLHSYSGVYVDEYQDCSLQQHELVLRISDVLPCRILGDPLQGIFDFDGTPQFSWKNDVLPRFDRLNNQDYPWRWHNGNIGLGSWLLNVVRPSLKDGRSFDLRDAPEGVTWDKPDLDSQRRICYATRSANLTDSVVAIHKYPSQAHSTARMLGGTYSSMDEVEGRDLIRWAESLERYSGHDLVIAVIEFAAMCMTDVRAQLSTVANRARARNARLASGLRQHKEIAEILEKLVVDSSPAIILQSLHAVSGISNCRLFRHELWMDMTRSLRQKMIDPESSLVDAAKTVRDSSRIVGRLVPMKSVSRILLIKGLEFQHAIVLNADNLNAKELYVAMTRGSKSLVVLSSNPIIKKPAPFR
jgi:DNA helicase-2/ATP-dependent DNA helicase PcrA